MSLLDALRAGVQVADTVMKSMQSVVQYEKAIELDETGVYQYAAPYGIHAFVDDKSQQVRSRDGTLKDVRTTLTLTSILEVVFATAGEGVSVNDRFTLPDGSQSLVIDVDGFIDASTGHPIATTVRLG